MAPQLSHADAKALLANGTAVILLKTLRSYAKS